MVDGKTLVDIVGWSIVGLSAVGLGTVLYHCRPSYMRKFKQRQQETETFINYLSEKHSTEPPRSYKGYRLIITK